MPALIALLLILLVVLLAVGAALRRARRADFIHAYALPQGLFEKLRAKHPQLTLKDCQLVAQALRQFFLAYLQGGRQAVSMPNSDRQRVHIHRPAHQPLVLGAQALQPGQPRRQHALQGHA